MSICDVRDVADTIVTLAKKSQHGRRYILAGQNMLYIEAWKKFAEIANGRPPICRFGPIGYRFVGRVGDLVGTIRGCEGDVNSAMMQMSAMYHYYSSERAKAELGYQNRPLDETVRDAWEWFKKNGYA